MNRGEIAPTFRACPEQREGSAHAELKFKFHYVTKTNGEEMPVFWLAKMLLKRKGKGVGREARED